MITYKDLLFALDSTDNVVVMTTIRGEITYVNKAFENLHGYKGDEVIGQDHHLFKKEADLSQQNNDLWDTLMNGESYEGDFKNFTRDHREIWEHTKISPIKNELGSLEGFILVSENVTFKRIQDQQILEEQFLLNELVANSPIAITIAQPILLDGNLDDFIILKANPVAGSLFNRIGITGLRLRTLMPSFSVFFTNLYDVNIEKRSFEAFIPELDKYLSFRTFPLPNSRFCILFYDVTESKRTLSALQTSEQRYSSLVEDTPAIICRFDINMNITYVNKYVLYDRNPYDFIGQSFYSLFDENASKIILKNIDKLVGNNATVDFEMQLPIRNQMRWIKWVVRALTDAQGRIFDYQAVGFDFTDFKMAQQALAENRNMLNSIVSNSLIGILVVNVNDEIVFVNSRMADMFLYSEREFLKMDSPQFIFFDDQDDEKKRFFNIFNDHCNSFTTEKQYKRKDGSLFWASLYLSPIRDAFGNIREVVCLIADVDQKKQFEMQLVEDEKKLKALNATKDKLFSIIAHDIKNPFNAILGFASILHAQIDDFSKEEIKMFVDKILESGENTYKLLEDLLTWGRSQLGKLSLSIGSVSPSVVVNEIFNYYSVLAQNKSIHLVNSLPDDFVVLADVDMLKFILRNLIHNAIKFTNESGTVECFMMIDAVSKARLIAVKDNGIGIKPEKQEVLFDINAYISTNGTANEKGTGLGLSLSKEMVEKNNGSITVDSKVNEGTTFIIQLPEG